MENTNSAPLADTEGWRWLERPDVTHLPFVRPQNVLQSQSIDGQPKVAQRMASVFVLTHAEHVNLPHIISRLSDVLIKAGEQFELIVIDEGNFYLNTQDYLRGIAEQLPLQVIKPAVQGALTSADLEKANGDRLVIFDADLHHAPDVIVDMLHALEQQDVVVGRVPLKRMPWYRAVQTVCSRLLLLPVASLFAGVPQPGQRAYRRDALSKLAQFRRFRAQAAFDTQALFFARRLGLRVGYVEETLEPGILFGWTARRTTRQLTVMGAIYALRAIMMTEFAMPFLFPPTRAEYSASGFTNVRDFLFLSDSESAKQHITKETVTLCFWVILLTTLCIVGAAALFQQSCLRVVLTMFSMLYLALLFIKLFVTIRSTKHSYLHVSPAEIATLSPQDFPVISILIPLYREREIIPQICRRLADLDYPVDKLDIIFILESTDRETIDAFLTARPPTHFKALLSPDVLPKTKPKALNVAFQKSRGEVVVIYDAEVLPELDQLKKACFALKKYPEVMFVHTRLNVYNAEYNWLTKLYTAEFSFYYDSFINGLVSLNIPLPISGHSIYFRRHVIEQVGGWDPYNVAEDCDIGIRIFRHGFGCGIMIDSFAWEQSTTTIPAWVSQRTRWLKGFLQTTMVHLRFPLLLKQDVGGWRNFLWFLILVPGTTLVNALNLLQSIFLLAWFVTHSLYIELAYEGLPIYAAMFTFIVGNYLFTFFNILGLYTRGLYAIMLLAYFSPFYWIMLGYATVRSILEFFFAPRRWNKTVHSMASTSIANT